MSLPGGCVPVIVEGVWSAAQTKTVKNKLQLYFQSKKKSGGGECRVEAEEGALRAAVYFRKVKLVIIHLLSESIQSFSVVLDNVGSNMSRDLLLMLVETISGLDDSFYSLEIIVESDRAVVTFKIVKNICIKQEYVIGSTPVKVYPYYESLGTALYGKERPTWKMPEPFTEGVHPVIWKFLQMKKLSNKINDQMRPYFCSVNMENPEVKLSPIPNFLRQKGLTAQQVDMWKSTAQDAFRQHMSQYTAFECTTNGPAWKAAEKDVRSVVREDAHLVLDASRGVLTVAGKADNVKTFRVSVENIVSKALSHIERQTNGVSEVMNLAPAVFYILQQEGIQKATQDISPEMNLSYDKNSQKLTITGLSAEVSKTKAWILERNVGRSKKQIELHSGLLDFLKTVDPMDMSHHLFTSHGISAIFSVERKGVLLLGSSEGALADAERKINASLTVMMLDVEDQAVLNLPNWADLHRQLLDTYNSSNKKTVSIQIYPGRQDQITVAGFLNPVKEVSRNLSEFIKCYSRIEERIRSQSAVVEFIDKKKKLEWSSIAKDNDVKVNLDPLRQRIYITGARLHVQKAKSCLEELTSSLFSDNLRMNKPGAKKYFQSQESWFQANIMSEFSCVVMLRPENQEEEEEENYEDENGFIYCKVKTAGGVLVSVSKADICHFGVDAVVNAANEELQHIGGLALAMLKAAGPELQKISNNYVSKNGKLHPSDAIVTSACNLPCKYIVHAVGPRFSDYDKKTAVSRLKRAVSESLRKAESVNCSTVALPAISSGVFGFPVDLCAETIAEAVREYCDSPESPGSLTEIHLVDNNDNTVRVLAAAFNKEFSDLGPTMTLPPQSGGQNVVAEGLQWRDGIGRASVGANMNLTQGAVSKAILLSAGPGLQAAVTSEAGVSMLQYGDVIITDSFNLMCHRVFHVVCPGWDNGGGQTLITIIRYCLAKAEKLKMTSLSFPAIGTGNLSFPKDVVSRVLLKEIHNFSSSTSPRHLREVAIVVHPSDRQTVDVTSKKSDFGVGSPSLGVYQMQMGTLTLEVSSGDITKETCDVIINASNQTFNLQSGVSKAILDSAGMSVQMECAQIGMYLMIVTSAGQLPSRNIIHIVGQSDPVRIKEMVYSVLKICEENKFKSVAFPALGTGANPSLVADAMVDAVVDFVRKKRPKSVHSVKILIFQTFMVMEFHKCMKKREGEGVEEKGFFTKIKGIALVLAKKKIEKLILDEQAEKTIQDQYISQLSQEDMEKLKDLQRNLTVSIRLDKGQEDKEPKIHLEGLTRDVSTAEEIIQRVERQENLRSKAILASSLVEWQFQHPNGNNVSFDIFINLKLEEALEKKELVKIKINNENYNADVNYRKAISVNGHKMVELLRKDLKSDAPLPSNWEDMKGDLIKLFALTAGSKEYKDVETKVTKTGLTITIISIERVQSPTLWQSYQLKKKHMEKKNNHTKNEKRLFHGTGADSIDLINKDGFNRSYAGKHAAMYGNGTYFAVDPRYSAQGYASPDTQGHKRMYLARVLVGDFTQGRGGMLTPPAKSGNTSDLYDSVTDNKSPPSMFIVFNDTHAYPEYLITFT
uniref:Poly [ADP-ribose] polymerase n=1 Tax=Labrus bergylta TaxID=56723 RepID=A0A3Q3GV61_9LABR